MQELNNVLDGGKVLAFAETKTVKFSKVWLLDINDS